MGKKVFISSTCFDLKDVRAEVANALREWGYRPLWNESPDFPRTSGCHSHDICLNAVKETDIYLLIIDKRYGGTYAGYAYPKEDISITWYETQIAFQEGKEIYTFVRDEVWNERPTYKSNVREGNTFKPHHVNDPRVFDFIDFIVHQQKDNWIDQFKDSVELKEKLKAILRVPSSEKVRHLSYIPNIIPPEPNFVGCKKFLKTITEWYKDPNVHIGALIGWGGVGKSAITRKWYDSLDANNIKPTGIFWWNFYKDKSLDKFSNKLLSYLAQDKINLKEFKNLWAKVDKINELIHEAEYLIILDGFEEIQKGEDHETEFGYVQHGEIKEILTNLADSKAKGLCLITTRYPLKDIENWEGSSYKRESIVDLEMEDAKALLRKRNINGKDEEFEKVITKYKGHALALTSLAGYLNRYYKGDITKSPDIPFIYQDSKRWKDVNKLLRKYTEKMSEAEIAFMQIFSLFRTEVTEKNFVGVFRKPVKGTRFNKALINMSKHDFIDLVQGLVEWRILSYNESSKAYTTHPLVKGYFEHIFRNREKKLCHKAIYNYIGSYAPEMPDTLEEMQPLFELVYHGCKAGLYDEVFDNVYWNKIRRGDEFYLTAKLGGRRTNLNILLNFFPVEDISKMPRVTKKYNQRDIINSVGLALLHTGNLPVAGKMFKRYIKLNIKSKDWENASVGYRNLSEFQFRTGEIINAIKSAKNAIAMAKWIEGKPRPQAASKAFLAYTLFLLGRTETVEIFFKEADDLFKESRPDSGGLYSIWGVFYIDFLIRSSRIDEAFNLSIRNFDYSILNKWPDEISRFHRSLGTLERIKRNYDNADVYLNKALEIARDIGISYLEIEALIERGRLRLKTKDYKGTETDLKDVFRLVDRTGFKLYEPDAEVVLAKVHLAQGDKDKAKEYAQSAYDKAKEMSYYWPQKDAEEVLNSINNMN